LDGRQTYDYRSIKISFGTDYGCCFVDLGKTRRVFLPLKAKKLQLSSGSQPKLLAYLKRIVEKTQGLLLKT
jgi:hypothetical protein